jgi:hypothetical protein
MKTLWKILLIATPLVVFTSCGKGKSGITGNVFNQPRIQNPSISPDLAEGYGKAPNLKPLKNACQNILNGRLNLKYGQVCATAIATVTVDPSQLDPTTIGKPIPVLATAKKGNLVSSSDTVGDDTAALDILQGSVHLMNVGDTKTLSEDGPLEFSLKAMPKGIATVVVYQCFDKDLNPAGCDVNVLKGN